MAQRIIDLGTSPNKGDGDPLRTAFTKINDNFTELYTGSPIVPQDLRGSVFGDDSTLLVDGVNSSIPKANIEDSANWDTAFAWGNHSTAGYALQATTYTKTEVDLAIAAVDPFSGDVTGSVFADDSRLLVDGVNGKIVGDIQNNLIETNNITALPGDTDLYIQGGYYSGTPGNPARVNIGTTNTSTIVLGAGDAVIYVNGNASSEVAAGTGRFDTITGDLTGSVFSDDSTLIVDGVNGVIPTSVLEGDITNPIRTGDVVIESTTSPGSITLTQTGIGNISLSATAIDFNNSPIENFILSYITSGLTAPGSSVVAGNTEVTFNFSGSPTALTVEQDAITIGSGVTVDGFVGDVTGSVFGDDSTLLVDGVGGTIAGPISSINWMAASDSYLTISNGGSTGPGPIQIVASANLDLSSGTNNDINITPHGSGRVKVSDGAFGIVEAANFIGHADETMYLSSKTTSAESTHIALDSTSGVATTMYGAVDFVSGGSVDFTGSTVTGLPTNLSDFTNDLDYAPIVGGAIQANGLPSGTTFTDTLSLPVLTAEPSSPVNGMVAVADGTSWDPMLNAAQTMVVYLAGAWRQIAVAGV